MYGRPDNQVRVENEGTMTPIACSEQSFISNDFCYFVIRRHGEVVDVWKQLLKGGQPDPSHKRERVPLDEAAVVLETRASK